MDIEYIGRLVRKQRRDQKLKQAELASIAGVGTRFVSELENGKSSLEIGRVLQVLHTMGLELSIEPRGVSWAGSDGQ